MTDAISWPELVSQGAAATPLWAWVTMGFCYGVGVGVVRLFVKTLLPPRRTAYAV